MKKFAFIALSLAAAAFGHAGEIVHDGTFVRWDERTLSVGNGLFEAKFCMRGGILRTVSLVAGDVERLCLDEGNSCDELAVAEAGSGWSAAGDRELALSVSSGGKAAIVRVWPRASGPVVEQLPASPLPSRPGGKEWGSPVFSFGWNRFKSLGGCGDAIYFAAPHLLVRAFTPIDRTDLRAELLDEREFAMPTCEAMEFWTPDPVRFPRGLGPLVDAARNRGLSIGLWFGPDSSDDAANWEREGRLAARLTRLFPVREDSRIGNIRQRNGVAGRRTS